jgi:hypothetical protein
VKPNVIPDFSAVFGQNFWTNIGGKKVVVKMAFRPRLLNVEEALEAVFDGNDDDFSSDDDSINVESDYIIDMDLVQDVHDPLQGDDSNHTVPPVSVSDSDNVAGARGRGRARARGRGGKGRGRGNPNPRAQVERNHTFVNDSVYCTNISFK